MGCDIHLIVQARRDGRWEDVEVDPGEPDDYRDTFWEPGFYPTFALLADVRNDPSWDIVPIAGPRGLPDDFECQDDRWKVGNDGVLVGDVERNGKDLGEHSHSWVTLAELKAVPGDQLWALPDTWIPELEKCGAPEDVRLVFGFDS